MPAVAPEQPQGRIRVKLLSRFGAAHWLHQLPHNAPHWGRCEFLFERDAADYDWLVVYDDVPPRAGQNRHTGSERLACAAGNSLLVTTEPSSIKTYGDHFTRQFGAVLTSQEDWALPHPRRIYSQPALHWFYGVGATHSVAFDDMVTHPPTAKTDDLSMVFSPKSMRHTMHWQRHAFMRYLMDQMPEIAVFGRGARPLDDKAQALDPFRYHLAVENHIGLHHWTEKLADAFLGLALPFYSGCPNAVDYFPADSFIPVDMRDPAAALRTIRRAIAANEYERRIPAILEARRRVLYEYNLFAVLSREIESRYRAGHEAGAPATIYSRHALRRRSLAVRLHDVYSKVRARARYRFRGHQ